MTVIGTAYIDVEARTDGFERGLTSRIGGIARKAVGVFASAFVIKEGFNFLGGLVKDAEEANKVVAQTGAVIKSTGGIANVSAAEVDLLAGSISRKTGIDDEAIASGENLLLTFTNIRNETGKGKDIFNQATRVLVDMGAAMKSGPSGAAIQLGKALNDPVKGITALTRVGVTFTQQQKDQIAAMVKVGDTAGAQKVILDELNKEFGGSAEAQATASAKLSVAWGNLREDLGNRLLPIVEKVATFMADRLPSVMAAIGPIVDRVVRAIGGAVESVMPTIRTVIDGVQAFLYTLRTGFTEDEGTPIERFALLLRDTLVPAVQKVVEWVGDHLKPILIGLGAAVLLAAGPFTILVAAFAAAYAKSETFRDVLDSVGKFLTDTVGPAIARFAGLVQDKFGEAVEWVKRMWPQISEAVDHVMRVVRTVVETVAGGIAAFWRAWGDDLLRIVQTVWGFIQRTIENVVAVIQGIIRTVLAVINGDWGKAWDGIKQIIGAVWDQIKNVVSTAINVVKSIIGGVLSTIGTLWSGAWDAIKGKLGDIWDGITSAVRTGIGSVLSFFRDLPFDIAHALGDLAGRFIDIGWDIIRGLVKGIRDAAGDILEGVLDWVTDKIPDWKGPLAKDRQLLVPTGKAIMGGLVDGIKAGSNDVQAYLLAVTDNIVNAVGGAVQGIRGLSGLGGARDQLDDAVAERNRLAARQRQLPGQISAAEKALSAAREAAEDVTPAERLAINRAKQDVLDKEAALNELIAEGTATTLQRKIAEDELRIAKQGVKDAEAESVGVTQELTAATDALNALRTEQAGIADQLAAAERSVENAQLSVVEAQAAMQQSAARLAADPSLLDWFREVAREAGLSERAIRDLTDATTEGPTIRNPTTPTPSTGTSKPIKKTTYKEVEAIGLYVKENWSSGKINRLVEQVNTGETTLAKIIKNVDERINGTKRMHSGGLVTADMATWPGLGANERPAIVQVGERVVARGGQAPGITVAEGAVQLQVFDPSRLAALLNVERALGDVLNTAVRLRPVG